MSLARDAQGQTKAVSLSIEGTAQTLASDIQYMPFGPLRQLTWGDGSVLTRDFDADGRVVEQQTDGLQHLSWSYAVDGNITAMDDLEDPSQSQAFDYDALHRLTSAQGAYGNLAYAYDAVGNRTELTENGSPTTYAYANDSNRLLDVGGTARAYDPAGNTTAIGTQGLNYDEAGRLAQVQSGSTTLADYDYNVLGQRVRKVLADGTTHLFAYNRDGRLIGEYDGSGSPVREYIYLEDRPIAMVDHDKEPKEIYYVHTDHLGTPRLLSDDAGQVVWEASYRPFGEASMTGSVTQPIRFPGQYHDPESGLHYNYFRDYEPGTGRYIESDPLGLQGSLNTFEYGTGNPLRNIDPFGLTPWDSNNLVCLNPMDCYCEYAFFGCDNDKWEEDFRDSGKCFIKCMTVYILNEAANQASGPAITQIAGRSVSRAASGYGAAYNFSKFYVCIRDECSPDQCD